MPQNRYRILRNLIALFEILALFAVMYFGRELSMFDWAISAAAIGAVGWVLRTLLFDEVPNLYRHQTPIYGVADFASAFCIAFLPSILHRTFPDREFWHLLVIGAAIALVVKTIILSRDRSQRKSEFDQNFAKFNS